MKNLVSLSILIVLNYTALFAQKSKDEAAIRSMTGCYQVEFRYAEVFSPDTAYKFPKREYLSAYELVSEIPVRDNMISLQHLLIVGDTHVVKHWRQDWVYENTEAILFDKKHHFDYAQWSPEKVKGQWSQMVTQVDDSPRYMGTGQWVHANGKTYWESEADAPLPRREKKAGRRDYNVLNRNNRHEITDYGWLHLQENRKINEKSDDDRQMIALEMGYNTYTKVDDKHCQLAADYWQENHGFWKVVREEWLKVMDQKKDFKIEIMSDKGFLYMELFAMLDESKSWNEKKLSKEVNKLIESHVVWE